MNGITLFSRSPKTNTTQNNTTQQCRRRNNTISSIRKNKRDLQPQDRRKKNYQNTGNQSVTALLKTRGISFNIGQ